MSNHAHYWLCEPPNGPVIPAVCRVCGQRRTFDAHADNESFRRSQGRGAKVVREAWRWRWERD